jgi:hypothetical protein
MAYRQAYSVFNSIQFTPQGLSIPFDQDFSEYITNVTINTGGTSEHVVTLTKDGFAKAINRTFEKPTLTIEFSLTSFPTIYKTLFNARTIYYDVLLQYYVTGNPGGDQMGLLCKGVYFGGLTLDVKPASANGTFNYETNFIQPVFL